MQKGGEVLPKRKSELCLYSRVKLWKIDSPPKLSIQLAKVSEPMSAQVCFSVARGMLNHVNISRMSGRTKNETINASITVICFRDDA